MAPNSCELHVTVGFPVSVKETVSVPPAVAVEGSPLTVIVGFAPVGAVTVIVAVPDLLVSETLVA
jgi:hypothetical protein